MGEGQDPKGCKNIHTYFFNVNHDSKYNAILVADGHLTDVLLSSVCSGVASLRGVRLVLFLVKLNVLEFYETDIGHACL